MATPTTPAARQAAWELLQVEAAMHPGVITCLPTTPLRDVARMMAGARIHAVVVWGDEEDDSEGVWGVVSDLDLAAAAARGELRACSAVGAAGRGVVTITPEETLRRAAELMQEHSVTHLVVAGPRDRPVGVLSTLDLARAVAAG
jgi:CBS domain-containing protein